MTELSEQAKHLGLDEELQEPDPPQIIMEDEQAEPSDRPEWLPEKYKTPEELVAAQKEAERAMHEANQRAAELEKRMAALEQQRQPEPQYSPYEQMFGYDDPFQQATYRQQLEELAQENPLAAMEALLAQQEAQRQQAALAQMQQAQMQQQQMQPWQQAQQRTQAQLIADAAAERVAGRHEDYDQYHEDVVRFLNEEDPGWIQPGDAWDLEKFEKAVERAYMVKKAERITAQEQELRDAGLTPDEIERQRKMAAQTMRGGSARPDTELSDEEKQLAGIVAAGMDNSYTAARRTLWGDIRSPQT